MNEISFETKAVHSGINPEEHNKTTQIPVYGSASFAYNTAEDLENVFQGKQFGYVYSRIANPTITSFEQKINSLENGIGAIGTSSGMAAINSAILALTKSGDQIIASKSLFGGTFSLFNKVISKFGVKIKYVNTCDIKEYENSVNEKTKCIFIEIIGNPKLDIPDIKKIADISSKNNIPLIVDCTLATPYLFQAKNYGISIVIHSATKYLAGNGSTIGGVVIDLGNFNWENFIQPDFNELKNKIAPQLLFLSVARKNILQNIGSCLSPYNAYLLSTGIETLPLRMNKHCENALKLAKFLSNNEKVAQVNYPGFLNNPFHKIAKKYFNNKFGGLLTFKLGNKEKCFKFINNLKIAKNLANLGDAKTLVIHPASTIYHECSQKEKEDAGVSENLIRVSVGIENIKDIIADFSQSLKEV